ncbi:MAG: Rieske (2Fe-2S) protein [Alphaproteobacteria bacterium]|nr:MAG: Rieske (2Fe-2S) protein [Alphaproteobacteria bacterium]
MVAGRWSAAPGPLIDHAPTGRLSERPLCRLDDIADGASRGFDPLDEGRDTMFVVRWSDAVFGWRNACPHYDFARMAWKKDAFLNADGTRIRCSAHGALFGIEDGVCEVGPCIGEALTPVLLAVHDGVVWLCGDYQPGLRTTRELREV